MFQRKVSTAEMRRDQAQRMVAQARDTYSKEEVRVTDETRHAVVQGYCAVMKQEYLLVRGRIQEVST